MTFLQPLLLLALPLVALPIVIHLINQRRYQTIRWAAMMFLLAANRMARGYARLRQWLVLLFRMLAIAGVVFTVSRPLASGWLGLTAGSQVDTTMILLDRSPSMRQQGRGTLGSKLETGRQQLARTLSMLASTRWVLIDSATNLPHEIDSPKAIENMPESLAVSASADVPAMLEAARDYIRANKCGRTEIWICSDIRQNDWNADSGRWQSLRESFREFSQGVRFHLLAYPQPALDNLSIRVTEVRRRQIADNAELLVSLRLTRETNDADPRQTGEHQSPARERGAATIQSNSRDASLARRTTIPLQFEIDGARSEITVEMDGGEFELKDHRIPLDSSRERGWGRVSIPADSNLGDNEYYFVFDQTPLRRTIIVTDAAGTVRPLQLAAAIAPDPTLRGTAEISAPDQLSTVDWPQISLLIWQAPLPKGDAASTVQAFIDRGGQVIFFPPPGADDTEFLGHSWGEWVEEKGGIAIETWRGDQDLLANTQSGATLPVGQLQVRRYRRLAGEMTPLATMKGGAPLVSRAPAPTGGVYFCATTVSLSDSSLASNGVVLYVLVQRALASGSATLGNTRQLTAGESSHEQPTTWQRVAGPAGALSTEFSFHGGVYYAGDRVLAVNRAAAEDRAPILADHRIASLFQGLDFARVDDEAGSIGSLIQEIWRLFLAALVMALIVEAALCLPKLGRSVRSPVPVSQSMHSEFETVRRAG
jgi:Aerotolerance regulator N-terminal